MLRAIFLKEWIKLRLPWLLLLGANLGYALYLCLRLRHLGELRSLQTVWDAWLVKGYLFCGPYQWAPALTAILLASLQFLPEVSIRRIRLVLHLPCNEERMVALHLLAGWLLATLPVLASLGLFLVWSGWVFPSDFQRVFLPVAGHWLLSGCFAYLFTSAAFLEVSPTRRVILLLLGAALVQLCLQPPFHDSGLRLLPGLLLVALLCPLIPLLAAFRFRKGLHS